MKKSLTKIIDYFRNKKMNFLSWFNYEPEEFWKKRGKMYFEDGHYDDQKYRQQEKLLLEHLRTFDFSTVFEVGCGYGRITKLILENFGIKDYLGIDLSPFLIEKVIDATKNFKNIKFEVANITKFQEEKKYDLVLASEVLVHIRPEDIDFVIDKLISFSNKHVVSVDWYKESQLKLNLGHNFVHDYANIYKKNPLVSEVNQERIPINPPFTLFHAQLINKE